jgi:hypothetical protein
LTKVFVHRTAQMSQAPVIERLGGEVKGVRSGSQIS